jgi:integrase
MKDKKREFDSEISSLSADKAITEDNKRIFRDFIKFKQGEGVTFNRLNRIIGAFKPILRHMIYDLDTLDDKKAIDIVVAINSNSNWKDWTKTSNVKVFKNFLRWFNRTYDKKINTESIKPIKPKNSIMPEYLITPDEFHRLLAQTPSESTKLVIELLYESGARISEVLDLKIQNVEFNSYGAKIYVKGKTGQRVIPIIWYANELRHFIESHPNKADAASPLFFDVLNSKIIPLKYDNFRYRLIRICRSAGINKRIYAHLFRHTRMTELAKTLPEQTLKALAGWSGSSNMAQTYIHLSQRDVEDSLLQKVYGISTDTKEDRNTVKICPRCKETNPYFNALCQRCGAPLDDKELIKAEIDSSPERLKEVDSMASLLLNLLRTNPQILEGLKDGLKTNGHVSEK